MTNNQSNENGYKKCRKGHIKTPENSYLRKGSSDNPYCRRCKVMQARRDNRLRKIELVAKLTKGKNMCVKCGYSNIDALVIDHINDDGVIHRGGRREERTGKGHYSSMISKGELISDFGLQVLCANCNTIKEAERKRKFTKCSVCNSEITPADRIGDVCVYCVNNKREEENAE